MSLRSGIRLKTSRRIQLESCVMNKLVKLLEKFDKRLSKVKLAQVDPGKPKNACKTIGMCNHIE